MNIAQYLRSVLRVVTKLLPLRNTINATQILIGPHNLRSVDGAIFEDILSGNLTFGGRHCVVKAGSLFDFPPPSVAFAQELHEFGWLRHMSAINNSKSRQSARIIIADWIQTYGQTHTGFSMQPALLARRLIAWISQAPTLLQEADSAFYDKFIQSLNFQASVLKTELKLGTPMHCTLTAWIALNYYAQCSDAPKKFVESVEAKLLNSLASQILPDGGHISRNPQILLDCVLDLLPLNQVFAARKRQFPSIIPLTIAKMLVALRLLRHSDGSLAAFNGMSVSENGLLARILPYLKATDAPLFDASYSGYQRIERGNAVVLVDAGRPPPAQFSDLAHAGCLSFEFSHANARLIVNCGSPITASKSLIQAARKTAAHSVLCINNASSCHFAADSSQTRMLSDEIISGPIELTYGREIIEEGEMLIARHDGYVKDFGIIHQRSLWLNKTGLRLEGQDKLTLGQIASKSKMAGIAPVAPFCLNFHLHPNVRAELNDEKTRVKLWVNQEQWQFVASDRQLALEPSLYFATAQGQQKTVQIVVMGLVKPDTVIDWVFERVNLL